MVANAIDGGILIESTYGKNRVIFAITRFYSLAKKGLNANPWLRSGKMFFFPANRLDFLPCQ